MRFVTVMLYSYHENALQNRTTERLREIFPLSDLLFKKTNIVSGGKGADSSLQNTKGAKCPRTIADYYR